MLKTIARLRPFLTLAVFSVVLIVLGFELEDTISYDDGGMGTFVFFSGVLILAPLRLLYSLILFVENDPGPIVLVLVTVLMVLVYVLLDRWLLRRAGLLDGRDVEDAKLP